METLTKKAAQWAKANGYEYLTTVVKVHYSSTYYHYNTVDSVLRNGWTGAPTLGSYNCRQGTLYHNLPSGRKIALKDARAIICNSLLTEGLEGLESKVEQLRGI